MGGPPTCGPNRDAQADHNNSRRSNREEHNVLTAVNKPASC